MTLPNQLTILRILLTPVFIFLLFLDHSGARLASFVIFTLASLTDWYDGFIARKYRIVSKWGKFLDPLADKILVCSGLVSFGILGYIPAWMIMIIILRDVLMTGFRSYALFKEKPVRTNFFAKMKTFGQMTVLFFIFLYHLAVRARPDWIPDAYLNAVHELHIITILMFLVTALTVISGVIYFIENRFYLRQMKKDISRMFAPSDV